MGGVCGHTMDGCFTLTLLSVSCSVLMVFCVLYGPSNKAEEMDISSEVGELLVSSHELWLLCINYSCTISSSEEYSISES